jgi:hypothetical protein
MAAFESVAVFLTFAQVWRADDVVLPPSWGSHHLFTTAKTVYTSIITSQDAAATQRAFAEHTRPTMLVTVPATRGPAAAATASTA